MSDIYEDRYKSIATWLSKDDYEKLKQLACNNKVTISTYLRAIIVDVLFEEYDPVHAALATTIPDVIQNGRRRPNPFDQE